MNEHRDDPLHISIVRDMICYENSAFEIKTKEIIQIKGVLTLTSKCRQLVMRQQLSKLSTSNLPPDIPIVNDLYSLREQIGIEMGFIDAS